jgi:hypothetical protein
MIDDFKEAIQNGDWDGVVKFYTSLVGLPPVISSPREQKLIRQVETAINRGQNLDFQMRPDTSSKAAPAKPAKPKRVSKKKAKAREIAFVDTGEKVEENGADKINDNVSLTPRTRKPFKTIKMTCISCKSTEEVAPIFKRDPEVYKCNKCLSKGRKDGVE